MECESEQLPATEWGYWVLVRAQRIAFTTGSPCIDAEHLLASLLDSDGNGVRILYMLDIDVPAIRNSLAGRQTIKVQYQDTIVPMQQTAAAKEIICCAVREATAAHADAIGSEHLLLGLLAVNSPSSDMLVQYGVRLQAVRHVLDTRQVPPEPPPPRCAVVSDVHIANVLSLMLHKDAFLTQLLYLVSLNANATDAIAVTISNGDAEPVFEIVEHLVGGAPDPARTETSKKAHLEYVRATLKRRRNRCWSVATTDNTSATQVCMVILLEDLHHLIWAAVGVVTMTHHEDDCDRLFRCVEAMVTGFARAYAVENQKR